MAAISQHDAGEGEGDCPKQHQNLKPIAVEGLVDQDWQRVNIRNAPELPALFYLVDRVIKPGQHGGRL